jgi:hypothetical protein
MKPRLFHVSEEAGITLFEPRPSPSPEDSGVTGDCVWAVDEVHLRNYMFPRDCPRITYAAGPATTAADRERFLLRATSVAAIEHDWFERLRTARVSIYEVLSETFACSDAGAGYWISREAVAPVAERVETDLIGALLNRGVELRLLQDFWPLRDAVAASSLEFSIIRQRNARPRGQASQ